ncbi:hypothetical protein H6769_06450 [Candidatus Peribacteria bacterium]|nr:hypothetical protein [Candidatus Peribacteria bacterium]
MPKTLNYIEGFIDLLFLLDRESNHLIHTKIQPSEHALRALHQQVHVASLVNYPYGHIHCPYPQEYVTIDSILASGKKLYILHSSIMQELSLSQAYLEDSLKEDIIHIIVIICRVPGE